jgi:hypothetical protein
MPTRLLADAIKGTSRGTRFLPGGELLIVDSLELVAIDSQNRKRQLADGFQSAWGLAVDPKGARLRRNGRPDRAHRRRRTIDSHFERRPWSPLISA